MEVIKLKIAQASGQGEVLSYQRMSKTHFVEWMNAEYEDKQEEGGGGKQVCVREFF